MPRPINERLRQSRSDDILAAAREQLAAEGMAGFSLRAVARRLGLAPNSIYNYFPTLSDMVTALLVDAFERFSAAIDAAAAEPTTIVGRFVAACGAYRSWAVAHPIDYDLIFGSPLPDYEAPAEITGPLSIRSFTVLLGLLVEAWRAGDLRVPARYQAVPPGIARRLAAQASPAEAGAPAALRYLALVTWSRLHGMVTLEIHGNADMAIGDTAAFFDHGVACLCEEIGLGPASDV